MSWNNKGRHYFIWGIIVILVFAFIFGCSGGNRLSGTWENDRGWTTNTITFSGKNYTKKFASGRIYDEGTYSITGNQIEFVDSNGGIDVRSFSRTENTIAIGGDRYTRQK